MRFKVTQNGPIDLWSKEVQILFFFVGKLPKNYNSEVDPDPERWIPKRERTYYKGKRQKKGASVGR